MMFGFKKKWLAKMTPGTPWSNTLRWWRKKTTHYSLVISALPTHLSVITTKLSYRKQGHHSYLIQQMSLAQNTKSYANKPQTSETKAKFAGIVAGNIQSWHHPPSSPKINAVLFHQRKAFLLKRDSIAKLRLKKTTTTQKMFAFLNLPRSCISLSRRAMQLQASPLICRNYLRSSSNKNSCI